MLTLEQPFFLSLFFLLLVIFILKRNRKENYLYSFSIFNLKFNSPYGAIIKILHFFSFAAICLLILSLTSPHIIKRKYIYITNTTSVMFILDISPSMSIEDMQITNSQYTSRISSAKEIIKKFVMQNENIAIGLICFATDVSLIIPETTEHDIFIERLNSIEIGELGNKTSQGEALASALLHTQNKKDSYIIFLTDGENNNGAISPITVADIIKKRNTKFYVIGLGREGNGEIRYTDFETNTIISGISNKSFNEIQLKEIANVGDGKYNYASTHYELDLQLSHISNNFENTIIKTTSIQKIPLDTMLTSFAMILLTITWCIKRIIIKVV